MILIPIGQEDAVVRRHPVVCYTIIAINVVAFLATLGYDESAWTARIGERFEEVAAFVEDHPYLDVPETMASSVPASIIDELETAKADLATDVRLPDPRIAAIEQQQLDDLSMALVDIIGQHPHHRYGFKSRAPTLITMATSMFIHGDIFHLLGNMLFFYIAGPVLEDVYGRILFPILYLLAGAFGALLHLVKLGGASGVLIGASGAIAGLMGAFLVRLGKRRIQFLFFTIFMFRPIRHTFFLPAFVVIPLWFLEQALYAESAGGGGVAYWAHVGGFVFGVGAAFFLKVFAIEERYIHPVIESQVSLDRPPEFEAAIEARVNKQYTRARELIGQVLGEAPDDVDAWTERYEIELAAGDRIAAGKAATRLLELYVAEDESDLACELIASAPRALAGALPGEFFSRARGLLSELGREDLAAALRPSRPDDPLADAGALTELYRRGQALAEAGRAVEARQAFAQARRHPACNEAWRETIDRALRATSPRDEDILP